MLKEIVGCDVCKVVIYFEMMIIVDNEVFWVLFCLFVCDLGVEFIYYEYFEKEIYFGGQYDFEFLLCIGFFMKFV